MYKINNALVIITQLLILFDSTRQTYAKYGINALKTIGKTMKNPLFKQVGKAIKKPINTLGNTMKNPNSMFRRNTINIKNLAFGFQDKLMTTKHYLGSKSVKYLGEGGIKNFKYAAPNAIKKGIHLARTTGKKTIQNRSAVQINLIAKTKRQIPLLFVGGGMNTVTSFNLVPEDKKPFGQGEYFFERKLREKNEAEAKGEEVKEPEVVEVKTMRKEAVEVQKEYFFEKKLREQAEAQGMSDVESTSDFNYKKVNVQCNKTMAPVIKFQYCNSPEGQKNVDDAQVLIKASYPLATFEYEKDEFKTTNFIVNVNDEQVFDILDEEGKNFRNDQDNFIWLVKRMAE